MTGDLGWWQYDPIAPGMVNTVTGERVVYRGALGGHMRVTWSENWLRYDYIHSELTFPLVARTTVRERGSASRGRAECLSVDYPRSARLWRDDPFGNMIVGTAPAYGVWRRVDDCIVDAFSCWPRTATGGWSGDEVELVGGWLNGLWRPDFWRTSFGGHRLAKALQAPDVAAPDPESYLMDLWAKPAALWRHPAESGLDKGQLASVRDRLGLDAADILLVTLDGRYAIFHPDRADIFGTGTAVFYFVDLTAGRVSPFAVEIEAASREWHLRFDARPEAGGAPAFPQYARWIHCSWSVIDAFGAWQDARSKLGEEPNPLIPAPPVKVSLYDSYRGGVRLPEARCQINYG